MNMEGKFKVLIDPESLESILEYDPLTTIILGGETEVYRSVGFYYSFPSTENNDSVVSEFEQKLEALGADTCYQMHRALYHEEMLRKDREDVNNANVALRALIDAIASHDVEKISDILKYNMNTIIQTADKLQSVYTLLDEDKTWELKAVEAKRQCKEVTEKYNKLAEEVTLLRKKGDSSKELVLLQSEYNDLDEKYAATTNELAELKASLRNMHTHSEYEALLEKLERAEDALQKAQQTKQPAETNLFSDGAGDQAELIRVLKDRITALQQSSGVDLNEALPVLNNSLSMNATKLITLKEIKRAPYMTALLSWLNMSAISKKTLNAGVRTVIIVYDNLTDLNTTKYKKCNFAINEAPTSETPVVVTNNLTPVFLRNVVGIANYNKVIIIDRLGSNKIVTDRMDNVNYFLIDSTTDIADYGLNAKQCIAYYDSKGECAVDILPNTNLATQGKRERIFAFTQNPAFCKIFS